MSDLVLTLLLALLYPALTALSMSLAWLVWWLARGLLVWTLLLLTVTALPFYLAWEARRRPL